MDEIDAALGTSSVHLNTRIFSQNKHVPLVFSFVCSGGIVDFKNVSIVGHYVKDRTKDAQFIIIR